MSFFAIESADINTTITVSKHFASDQEGIKPYKFELCDKIFITISNCYLLCRLGTTKGLAAISSLVTVQFPVSASSLQLS